MEASLLLAGFLSSAVGNIVMVDGLDCPARADLVGDLAALGAPDLAARPETVELARTAEGLEVRLRTAKGELLAVQLLPADSPCETLAQAAALVLAGWSANWPAEPSRFEVSPLRSASSLAAPSVEVQTPASTPPSARRAWHLDLDGAIAGDVTSVATTLAGVLQFSALRPQGDLGGALGLLVEGARGSPFAPSESGSVSWRRTALLLGPIYRLTAGRWSAAAALQASLALVTADGEGVPNPSSAWSFNPGLSLALRGGYAFGAVEPFVGVWFLGWLPEQAQVQGVGSSVASTAALPQLQLLAGVGVAWTGL